LKRSHKRIASQNLLQKSNSFLTCLVGKYTSQIFELKEIHYLHIKLRKFVFEKLNNIFFPFTDIVRVS